MVFEGLDGFWARHAVASSLGDAHEVVGGGGERELPADRLETTMTGLAHGAVAFAHRAPGGRAIRLRSGGGRLLWGRRWIGNTIVAHTNLERAMTEPSPPTRNPVTLDHDGTLLVVIELSLKSWLAAAVVPLRRLADGASFGDGFPVF